MKILFLGKTKATAYASANSQFEYLALKKIYKKKKCVNLDTTKR